MQVKLGNTSELYFHALELGRTISDRRHIHWFTDVRARIKSLLRNGKAHVTAKHGRSSGGPTVHSRELGGWSMRLWEGLRDWFRGSNAVPPVLCERSCGGDQEHKLRHRESRSLDYDGSIRLRRNITTVQFCTIKSALLQYSAHWEHILFYCLQL